MYFKYFITSGFIALILLFIVQVLSFVRGLIIQSGFMDGSINQSLMSTKLIIVPILFLAISIIFFLLWFYKDWSTNKKTDFPDQEDVLTYVCKEIKQKQTKLSLLIKTSRNGSYVKNLDKKYEQIPLIFPTFS